MIKGVILPKSPSFTVFRALTNHESSSRMTANEHERQTFYALIPHNSAYVDLTNECALSFDRHLYCSKCQNLKYSTDYLPPIHLRYTPKKKHPIYWINESVYFTVITDEFLEILQYEDSNFRYFTIGEIYDKHGNLLNGYHTIKPFNYAIIRGSYKNFTNICEICGNVHCWPNGPDLYISPEIDAKIPVWGIGLAIGLIVSERVIEEAKKRKIKFKKIVEVKQIEIIDPKFHLDIPLFILDKGKKIIFPANHNL